MDTYFDEFIIALHYVGKYHDYAWHPRPVHQPTVNRVFRGILE